MAVLGSVTVEELEYAQALEDLAAAAYGEDSVTEVIRPAAIIPEREARDILLGLAAWDVASGGLWRAEPQRWQRYDRPWDAENEPGAAELLGTIQVIYGAPTRFEVTVYRVTVTPRGEADGWTVSALCDEALELGGLTLETCPRATLNDPPKPFHLR
jgi:hypothetical protein